MIDKGVKYIKTFQVTSMTRVGKRSNSVISVATVEDLKKTMKEFA